MSFFTQCPPNPHADWPACCRNPVALLKQAMLVIYLWECMCFHFALNLQTSCMYISKTFSLFSSSTHSWVQSAWSFHVFCDATDILIWYHLVLKYQGIRGRNSTGATHVRYLLLLLTNARLRVAGVLKVQFSGAWSIDYVDRHEHVHVIPVPHWNLWWI